MFTFRKKHSGCKCNNGKLKFNVGTYVTCSSHSKVNSGSHCMQAPTTMKSILQAGWLMTVACGNIITMVVAYTGSTMSQVGLLVIPRLLPAPAAPAGIAIRRVCWFVH